MALTSLPSRRPVAECELASPGGPRVGPPDLEVVLRWLTEPEA